MLVAAGGLLSCGELYVGFGGKNNALVDHSSDMMGSEKKEDTVSLPHTHTLLSSRDIYYFICLESGRCLHMLALCWRGKSESKPFVPRKGNMKCTDVDKDEVR